MAITLIIETGAGVVGANVYSDIDAWLAYAAELGQTDVADAYPISPSPQDDPDELDEMKAALIRGTRYVEAFYGDYIGGVKVAGRSQSLLFPRKNMRDAAGETIGEDEVPIEWRRAIFEAALRELTSPGSLSPDGVQSERVKSETLGPLSVTYADQVSGTKDALPSLPIIDKILAPLFGSNGNSVMFGETVRI